jgi:hypothetical protein
MASSPAFNVVSVAGSVRTPRGTQIIFWALDGRAMPVGEGKNRKNDITTKSLLEVVHHAYLTTPLPA